MWSKPVPVSGTQWCGVDGTVREVWLLVPLVVGAERGGDGEKGARGRASGDQS